MVRGNSSPPVEGLPWRGSGATRPGLVARSGRLSDDGVQVGLDRVSRATRRLGPGEHSDADQRRDCAQHEVAPAHDEERPAQAHAERVDPQRDGDGDDREGEQRQHAGDDQAGRTDGDLPYRLDQVSFDELDLLVQQQGQVAGEGGHQLAQGALA